MCSILKNDPRFIRIEGKTEKWPSTTRMFLPRENIFMFALYCILCRAFDWLLIILTTFARIQQINLNWQLGYGPFLSLLEHQEIHVQHNFFRRVPILYEKLAYLCQFLTCPPPQNQFLSTEKEIWIFCQVKVLKFW